MNTPVFRSLRSDLVLIDSSAWICYASRKGYFEIKEAISQLLDEDRCAITGPAFFEIVKGTRTAKERDETEEQLSALRWLNVKETNWGEAARLAFKLRRNGVTVPAFDTLIATIAIGNNFELMHNDKHFRFIAEHSDLKLFDLTPYCNSIPLQ